MGFFSFRREQVTDDDLRDALFAAAAASDIRALKKLASRHLERVVQLFPTWKTLPPDVLSDPTRTKHWAEGVTTLRVREQCARIGDEEGRDIHTRNLETIDAPAAIAFRDAQGRLTADERC